MFEELERNGIQLSREGAVLMDDLMVRELLVKCGELKGTFRDKQVMDTALSYGVTFLGDFSGDETSLEVYHLSAKTLDNYETDMYSGMGERIYFYDLVLDELDV